jgi:DNA mismatch repair protein MutS2
MEFDPVDQKPTYRVRVGEIGVSHAFEIAEKTGLPSEITAKAKEYVQGESAILDSVIKSFREKEALYEKLSSEYKEKLEMLEEKLKKAEKIGRETAQRIIANAREEVDKLLKELRREENRDKIRQLAKEVKRELVDLGRSYELDLKPPVELVLNKEYFIKPVGVMGVLKEIKKDKALIQIGKTFMEVPITYLYERG